MSASSWSAYLLVAVGGALGAACRYHAAVVFGARPLTTFAVNIVGSFLIGILAAFAIDMRIRLFLATGLLGGFTTFSTWQLEALNAARTRGGAIESLSILLGSLTLGIVACWSGFVFGQKLR